MKTIMKGSYFCISQLNNLHEMEEFMKNDNEEQIEKARKVNMIFKNILSYYIKP